MTTITTPTPLGIGFTWQPDLKTALGRGWELLDFVEVSPDVLCRETITDGARQFGVELAQFVIGQGRRFLEQDEGAHERRMCPQPADRKVLYGPLGLSTVQCVGGNPDFSHRVLVLSIGLFGGFRCGLGCHS